MKLLIFDNGGESADRYLVYFMSNSPVVYAMSEDACAPNGVCYSLSDELVLCTDEFTHLPLEEYCDHIRDVMRGCYDNIVERGLYESPKQVLRKIIEIMADYCDEQHVGTEGSIPVHVVKHAADLANKFCKEREGEATSVITPFEWFVVTLIGLMRAHNEMAAADDLAEAFGFKHLLFDTMHENDDSNSTH